MDFTDVITNRESIRAYDPERPLPDDVLMRIIEAGRIAPSAANRQPWRFIVVRSEAALARMRPCYPAPWFHEAPCILVVAGIRSQAWVRKNYDGYCALETDATIAMDHMILAAENEDVGTCWIAAFDPDVVKNALELTDDEVVFALTPLGYLKPGYTRHGDKKRKSLDEVLTII